jgi:hypothetical protein
MRLDLLPLSHNVQQVLYTLESVAIPAESAPLFSPEIVLLSLAATLAFAIAGAIAAYAWDQGSTARAIRRSRSRFIRSRSIR